MEKTNLKKALDELGKDVVAEIVKKLLEADKKATGELINSVSYKVLETSNELMLNIMASDYFKNVDEGRRAGAKQPPINKILPWVEARGISFKTKSGGFSTPEQTAFVIARSISKKGIKPLNIKQQVIDEIISNKQVMILSGAKIDVKDYITKNIFNN